MKGKDRVKLVLRLLAEEYPEARCELDYRSPWELLVATVLSAQCTDERVNRVTPELFRRWPGPPELAAADPAELEAVIRPTGFFRNKARALIAAARAVVAEHGGEVPRDVDELVRLPGVGRKTANVVLGEACGIPAGIAVDTHVRRVARRLGLTEAKTPEAIEAELESLVPREEWIGFSLRLILHGRRVCTARRPRCEACRLEPACAKVGV
jgi:endonuclease III